MKLLRCITIIFICSAICANAQQNKQIDSLKLVLEHSKEDTNKVNVLNELARNYNNKRLWDSALKYGNLSLQLSEKFNYRLGLAYSNYILGYAYFRIDPSQSLNYFLQAIKIYETKNIKSTTIASALNFIGVYYFDNSDYSLALDYFLKSLKKREEIGDQQYLLTIYTNVGNAYKALNEIEKAFDYYKKALKIAEINNDKKNQIDIFNKMGKCYTQLDQDKALEYYLKALKISEDAKIENADLLLNIGFIYSNQFLTSKSFEYYFKSLKVANNTKDETLLPFILADIGRAYYFKGDYTNAIDYCIKALKIVEAEGVNKHPLVNIYMNLGNIYNDMGDKLLGCEYMFKAKKAAEEVGCKHIHSELGIEYYWGYKYIYERDYQKAEDHFLKVLKALEKTDYKAEKANILQALGEVELGKNEYKKALDYYTQSLNLSKANLYEPDIVIKLIGVGKCYALMNENIKAESYFLKAQSIIDTSESLEYKESIHESISNFYAGISNYEKALEHYKKAVTLKDSLLNESTNNKISQLKIEYETEKKDQEIANLNKEQKIKDLEIEQKKKELQAQQLEQEKKQQAIALLESSKKIQALSLQKKEEEVKNLLKEQQIKNLQIQQNQHELQTRQLEKDKQQQSINLLLSSQKIQDLQLKQKQTEIKRRTGIYIASLSLIILGIISLGLYYRNKQSQQKIKTEREIAQLEQKALQLQMNPHFIFNSLNSIGHYMLKHEAELAEEFLTRFSRLTRLVLEASKESFIPLSQEIEILRYYVSLEQERFNHSFNFDITVKNNILTEEMMIPPMLVQPYIENAIIHGINKLLQRGNIEVIFQAEEEKENMKKISCIVRDNGIGINQSLQRKQEQKDKTNHRSIAMSNTKERLKVLSELYSVNLGIEIKDISVNQTSGTEVKFDIPVKMG